MKVLGLLCLMCLSYSHVTPVFVLAKSHPYSNLYGNQDMIAVKSRGVNPAQEQEGPQPMFDPNIHRNITAVATQTAFLHCKVKDLGAKAVSWIRQQDLHILTAGLFTYTSDQRFSVVQQPATVEDWILQIKFVQPRDAGVYECQVSTEPRILIDFYLNVVESTARIIGPSEVYVKKGSTLSLTCVVSHAVENAVIFWYHEINVLDEGAKRDVSIDFIHDSSSSTLTSVLRITNVQALHSGNYTCLPTAADPVSVIVHIINGNKHLWPLSTTPIHSQKKYILTGEHPAAMQHGNSAVNVSQPSTAYVLWLIFVCSRLHVRQLASFFYSV